MKYKLLLFIAFHCVLVSSYGQSVDCFESTRKRGIALFEQKKYDDAIRQFEAADLCPDKKENNDLTTWIKKCKTEKAKLNEERRKLAEQKREEERLKKEEEARLLEEEAKKNLEGRLDSIENSLKKAEEEQELLAWMMELEKKAAKTAYMDIRRIEFANIKDESSAIEDSEIIHPFGSDLYASDIKYLAARIYYDSAIQNDKKVTLCIKLIDPEGKLIVNTSSPAGYSFQIDKDIYGRQTNQSLDILSWGNISERIFYPGIWKLELWYDNQMIYETAVDLLKKPHEATYLTVNGQSELYINLDKTSGTIGFTVDTDANVWKLKNLPKWCDNNRIEESTFTLQYGQNANIPRIDTLVVVSDDKEVNIRLSQAQGTLSMSKNKWRNVLHRVFDHVTKVYDYRSYQGQLAGNEKNGFGIIRENNHVYVGEWLQDKRRGMGIYICNGDLLVPNCKKSTFFVGNFSNDQKNGMGYCYDKSGKLIYTGEFSDDAPIEKYPSKDNNKNKTFGCIEYINDAAYVGEVLIKDKREMKHGLGIHIWSNGDAWYGTWVEDKRLGKGVLLKFDGTVIVGIWDGDNYERID